MICCYYYYASKIKHNIPPEQRRNKMIVWDKVNELRKDGIKEAKFAYFFWILANILLAILTGLVFLSL